MLGDDAAVARAERPDRPVVLAQRHVVQGRARGAGRERAVAHLREHVAQLAKLASEHVVHVHQVLPDKPAPPRVGDVGA